MLRLGPRLRHAAMRDNCVASNLRTFNLHKVELLSRGYFSKRSFVVTHQLNGDAFSNIEALC